MPVTHTDETDVTLPSKGYALHLAPQLKGIHLSEGKACEVTVEKLECQQIEKFLKQLRSPPLVFIK